MPRMKETFPNTTRFGAHFQPASVSSCDNREEAPLINYFHSNSAFIVVGLSTVAFNEYLIATHQVFIVVW